MSYAPAPLTDLARYWVRQGGINSGIVGDAAHISLGVSYHLGKDHLLSTAYSIKTARDKAGLTNAASALDLGHSKKTVLRSFSKWLVAQGQKNAPGTRYIREIIYSPDGVKVLRWDRERGASSAPRIGEADDTHLWHTHISFYRDSENLSKVDLFKPYFEPVVAPPPIVEDEVILSAYLPGYTGTVKATANIRVGPGLKATVIRGLTAPEKWVLTGRVKGDVDPDGGSDQWYVRWAGGKWEYTAFSNIPVVPVAPASASSLASATAAAEEARAELAAAEGKITNAQKALA